MQSALSRTLCGMLSGALRISYITFPAFSTRSVSVSWPRTKLGKTSARPRPKPINVLFIPVLLLQVQKFIFHLSRSPLISDLLLMVV
jgi:hypothetical protein